MSTFDHVSTAKTILPRHIAAILDNLIAIGLSACIAKLVSDELPVLQVVCLVVIFLGYYFAFEAIISKTPGKQLTGLVVVRTDGSRVSVRDVAIRTAFRILEVNPVLLGGAPAALCAILSRDHQRFGDIFAGTVVIRASRV